MRRQYFARCSDATTGRLAVQKRSATFDGLLSGRSLTRRFQSEIEFQHSVLPWISFSLLQQGIAFSKTTRVFRSTEKSACCVSSAMLRAAAARLATGIAVPYIKHGNPCLRSCWCCWCWCHTPSSTPVFSVRPLSRASSAVEWPR